MKSKLFKSLFFSAIISLLFLSNLSYAQSGAHVDTTFNTKINNIFINLDKSKIPHGLLRDYAMEFTNIENYSGAALTDTNIINKGILREIYMTLATSRLTSAAVTTLPSPDNIDSLWQSARKQGQVTLCGLYYKYAYLSSTAVSAGKITVTNNQLFDKYVNNVYQNPYLQDQTAGFAPSIGVFNSLSFNILLPKNLWLSNSKNLVDHIEIDPNDGSGYRTITPGTALNVAYADTGLKAWNFKIYLTNSTILVTHTQINVYSTQPSITCNANGCGTYVPPGGGTSAVKGKSKTTNASTPSDIITGSGPYYFTTGETYNGIPAQGMVTIRFAPGHNTSIINPLIVAEGFDPGYYSNPENLAGANSITDFYNNVSYSNDLSALLTGSTSQYDIIYIDYQNGTDDIRRNALLVKSVIRWVNSVKTGTNQNVVLGLSMGGLVARYAIKKMENAGETPNVRLFINHGGPQLGADFPIGIQCMETDVNTLYLRSGLSGLYDIVRIFAPSLPIIGGVIGLNNTPAAEEMLLSHLNTSYQLDNSTHTSWQTELTALGYPTTCRNISISNGSECGQPQTIGQNGQLFYLNGTISSSFVGDILSEIASPFVVALSGQPAFILGVLPGRNQITMHYAVNTQKDGGGNQLYNGNITYKKTILYLITITSTITNRTYNGPSGVFPYETFPGDYLPIPPLPSALVHSGFLGKYNITLSEAPNFGFVPTASVLDIGKGSTSLTESDYEAAYSHDNPPVAPKNSPFANFVTAYYQGPANEQHLSYEQRNGTWLAGELNNSPITGGCSILCQAAQITGSSQPICSSAVYSITSAIPGADITWSTYPQNGVVSLSNTSGNSVTVTKVNDGTVTLYATIKSSSICSNTLSMNLNVGLPAAGQVTGPQSGCTRDADDYTFDAPGIPNATAWNWSTYPTTTFINSNGTSLCTIGFNVAGNYNIECDITTTCGVVKNYGSFIASDCGGNSPNYIVFPNPANSTMTVTQQPTSTATGLTNAKKNVTVVLQPFSYKLYDKKGRILKQGKSLNGQNIQISTTDLLSDHYYIHIITGGNVLKRQIIIQH